MRKTVLISSLALVAAVACAKKQPPPVTPMVTTDAGIDADLSDASQADAGAPLAVADAGIAAIAADLNDVAIDTAIKLSAVKLAPKMDPEGAAGRATLGAHEKFNMIVTMQPNRCYTILGFSPPGGVTDLELALMAPPLYTIQSGKSGAKDKNAPVIGPGAKALCPILPFPIAYRIDVTATKGAGRIGVQLFSRSK